MMTADVLTRLLEKKDEMWANLRNVIDDDFG
jgi:hypothetical protein